MDLHPLNMIYRRNLWRPAVEKRCIPENRAHGVRNTAEGLRYVIYLFVTDLKEPWKVIAEPAGFFDRAAWLGARQRCFQRGIYQWCYCG